MHKQQTKEKHLHRSERQQGGKWCYKKIIKKKVIEVACFSLSFELKILKMPTVLLTAIDSMK